MASSSAAPPAQGRLSALIIGALSGSIRMPIPSVNHTAARNRFRFTARALRRRPETRPSLAILSRPARSAQRFPFTSSAFGRTLIAVPLLTQHSCEPAMRKIHAIAEADLRLLRKFDTPTICNVVELYDL